VHDPRRHSCTRGPFSDRNGGAINDMAMPVALTPAQRIAWRVLILAARTQPRPSTMPAKLAIIPREQRDRGRAMRARH
jgi:hypothetical protein